MVTFSGTFNCKEEHWTYKFFLDEMALIVNSRGVVFLSCPEIVIELNKKEDNIELWKEDVIIERQESVTLVKIKRNDEWKEAAIFTKR